MSELHEYQTNMTQEVGAESLPWENMHGHAFARIGDRTAGFGVGTCEVTGQTELEVNCMRCGHVTLGTDIQFALAEARYRSAFWADVVRMLEDCEAKP